MEVNFGGELLQVSPVKVSFESEPYGSEPCESESCESESYESEPCESELVIVRFAGEVFESLVFASEVRKRGSQSEVHK